MEKSMSIGQDGALFEEWLEVRRAAPVRRLLLTRTQLRNGCLCCSVKDNGVKAIENLMKKRGAFDYILLETTGLADPAPIASIFWLDDALCSTIKLDGIVTMIDAKYCLSQLAEVKEGGELNEAVRQIVRPPPRPRRAAAPHAHGGGGGRRWRIGWCSTRRTWWTLRRWPRCAPRCGPSTPRRR